MEQNTNEGAANKYRVDEKCVQDWKKQQAQLESLKGNCNDIFNFLLCTFSECYRSISNGDKVLLPQAKYPRSNWQIKLQTPEYFLLWVGFIDYVDHGREACGAAKITYADAVITMSESDPNLGSYTDDKEADVSETERLSFRQTSSIPVP